MVVSYPQTFWQPAATAVAWRRRVRAWPAIPSQAYQEKTTYLPVEAVPLLVGSRQRIVCSILPSAKSVSRSESSTSLIFRAISISDLCAAFSAPSICSSCGTVIRFAAHDGIAIMGSKRRNQDPPHTTTPLPHRAAREWTKSTIKKHTLNPIEVAVLSIPDCGSLAKDCHASVTGVTTPNVKNRTLRKSDHSLEAAKGRSGLKAPFLSRPVACQV